MAMQRAGRNEEEERRRRLRMGLAPGAADVLRAMTPAGKPVEPVQPVQQPLRAQERATPRMPSLSEADYAQVVGGNWPQMTPQQKLEAIADKQAQKRIGESEQYEREQRLRLGYGQVRPKQAEPERLAAEQTRLARVGARPYGAGSYGFRTPESVGPSKYYPEGVGMPKPAGIAPGNAQDKLAREARERREAPEVARRIMEQRATKTEGQQADLRGDEAAVTAAQRKLQEQLQSAQPGVTTMVGRGAVTAIPAQRAEQQRRQMEEYQKRMTEAQIKLAEATPEIQMAAARAAGGPGAPATPEETKEAEAKRIADAVATGQITPGQGKKLISEGGLEDTVSGTRVMNPIVTTTGGTTETKETEEEREARLKREAMYEAARHGERPTPSVKAGLGIIGSFARQAVTGEQKLSDWERAAKAADINRMWQERQPGKQVAELQAAANMLTAQERLQIAERTRGRGPDAYREAVLAAARAKRRRPATRGK